MACGYLLQKNIEKKFPDLYRMLREIYYFKRERWKMPIIKGDFVKIFFTVENALPNMDKCDWAFTNEYDEILKHPRHMRISNYTFYSVKDPKDLIKRKNYNPKKIMNEKKKFCVFICSNDVKTFHTQLIQNTYREVNKKFPYRTPEFSSLNDLKKAWL